MVTAGADLVSHGIEVKSMWQRAEGGLTLETGEVDRAQAAQLEQTLRSCPGEPRRGAQWPPRWWAGRSPST